MNICAGVEGGVEVETTTGRNVSLGRARGGSGAKAGTESWAKRRGVQSTHFPRAASAGAGGGGAAGVRRVKGGCADLPRGRRAGSGEESH